MNADGAVLMPLPLSALRSGILVPVGAAKNVGSPVAIHIECGDALGMIRAKTMRDKRDLGDAARLRAGTSFALGLSSG